MNKYVKNLNRIEFAVTYACTGRCRHCSQGGTDNIKGHIEPEAAAAVVKEAAEAYRIDSVMTFGGEPLLYPETVYAVHSAAAEKNIPKRQLITNGFFSKDRAEIINTARRLAESGVNDILLSVDAFHQETIPLTPVCQFAEAALSEKIRLRIHPAWLVSEEHDNPYNRCTSELLAEFQRKGFELSEGNVIIPSGNALKYLGDYYDLSLEYVSPYEENPADIRAICLNPDGSVLGGNIHRDGIASILENYRP